MICIDCIDMQIHKLTSFVTSLLPKVKSSHVAASFSGRERSVVFKVFARKMLSGPHFDLAIWPTISLTPHTLVYIPWFVYPLYN